MSSRRIFRTSDAIADIDGIWDCIARDNPAVADRLIDELAERFGLLLKNPEIGEQQPLLADGSYRRSTCRSYVVYYRPLTEGIVIVRVLHGAQDHERLL
jgi:toxin ParE1/3/4